MVENDWGKTCKGKCPDDVTAFTSTLRLANYTGWVTDATAMKAATINCFQF